MNNKDITRITLTSVAIGIVFLIFTLVIVLNNQPNSMQELNSLIINIFGYVLISFTAVIITAVLTFLLFKYLDNKSVKTRLRLFSNNISAKLRLKNTNVIYPYLLVFLYETLQLNNDFLKLPLGKDVASLIPQGFKPVYRQNCVFYIFQLVVPENPRFEDNIIKQLMQSYINTELVNYGINGLSSCFKSRVFGVVPSVFIDRVYYNEQQHMLNFAVLYLSTEEDVAYMAKAIKRENEAKQAEKTVFDDEVLR